MKISFIKTALTAALATLFTLSCSNDNNGNDNNPVAVSSSSNKANRSSSSLNIEKSSSGINANVSSSSSGQGKSSSSSSKLISSSSSLDVEKSSSSQNANVSSSSSGYSNSSSSSINSDISSSSSSEPPAIVPPAITTASLPPATVGTAYSKTLTATGGTPISWSIKSGNLPAGLSLSGNTISGTPTAAGIFNIVIKATNAGGSDEKNFSIAVSAAAIEPTEGLMYWGHAASNDLAVIIEWWDWHIDQGLIESGSITGTVKEIQVHAGSGYRVILIPQSAGVPARIDDAGGVNVKNGFPMSNITIKGMPYYLFMTVDSTLDTGDGFRLTIKW